jgi:rare lipoprotein A
MPFVRVLFVTIVCCFPAFAADTSPPVVQHGAASYYADRFQGQRTASGERHDQNEYTAASRLLPLGARARVTNLETGKSVAVEINDRGPYARGRVIDLSKRAARVIGIDRRKGVARVKVEARAGDQPTPELKEEIAQLGEARAAPKKRSRK